MLAFISVLLGLMCFLICSCTGQEIIRAELGQNKVILPCKVSNNINIRAVKWIRPDQDPEYVLFYRDGHLDPDYQHPSFQNRVELKDKDMKDGDVSLVLMNVTKKDTGIYECHVFEEGKKEPISITDVEVVEPDQEKVSAKLGQDVILPSKVPSKYNINIIAVEWIRPDLDPEYVLVYRGGHIDPHNQHPSYQNRVDLQDKEMKDRDVSLILKNLKMEDTGRYKCRVFEKGNNEPISITILEVLLSAQEKVSAKLGQDVILPCKVPNIIITSVEWRRFDQGPEYVVVYQDRYILPHNQHESYQNRVDLQDKEMKDGDVSLILKNVKKNDTGIYECLVFEEGNKEPISITYMEVHGDQDRNTGDEGNKPGIIVGSVVGVIVLAVLGSVGFLIYQRHVRQNLNLPVPQDEPTVRYYNRP